MILGLLTATCYAGYLLIIRRGGRDLRRPAGPVAVATASTTVCAALVGIAFGTLDLTPGPRASSGSRSSASRRSSSATC